LLNIIFRKLKEWSGALIIICIITIIPIYWYREIVKDFKKQEYVGVSCFLEIKDGSHIAEVNYFNPNTGTRSTYKLTVEVESHELIKIYWPNGGWLDDFDYVEFDSGGYCSFTIDRGYQYEVQITDQ
jgi:hypothetical protein